MEEQKKTDHSVPAGCTRVFDTTHSPPLRSTPDRGPGTRGLHLSGGGGGGMGM